MSQLPASSRQVAQSWDKGRTCEWSQRTQPGGDRHWAEQQSWQAHQLECLVSGSGRMISESFLPQSSDESHLSSDVFLECFSKKRLEKQFQTACLGVFLSLLTIFLYSLLICELVWMLPESSPLGQGCHLGLSLDLSHHQPLLSQETCD